MGCCSCLPGCSKTQKREIVLGCFGIDGAGKTTVLRMIKGENPRGVLSTNGFSLVEFPYDSNFDIKVYDVGGGARIRGIWKNYYAEVHGIMYVHDAHDPASEAESRSVLAALLQEPDIKNKPLLIVINRIDFTFDDIAFAAQLNLHQRAAESKQHYFMIHVPEYNGYLDKASKRPPFVATRAKKKPSPLLDGFTNLIRRIQMDYVTLSEGVRAAEERLRLRQNEEREKRRLRLANAETNPEAEGIGSEVPSVAGSNGEAIVLPSTVPVTMNGDSNAERRTSSTGSPPNSLRDRPTPEPMGDIPSLHSGPTEPIGDDRPGSAKTFTQEMPFNGHDNPAYIKDLEEPVVTVTREEGRERPEIEDPRGAVPETVERLSRPPTATSLIRSRPATAASLAQGRSEVAPIVEESKEEIAMAKMTQVAVVRPNQTMNGGALLQQPPREPLKPPFKRVENRISRLQRGLANRVQPLPSPPTSSALARHETTSTAFYDKSFPTNIMRLQLEKLNT